MLFDAAGNLKVTTLLTTATPASWTPANWTGGFFSVVTQDAGFQSILIQLNQNSSITAGAVTWQGTYDGINWVAIPAMQVLDPTSPTFAQIANPYTFVPSTNKSFLILVGGYQAVRALESTPMTGAGASILPFISYLPYSPVGYALTNGSAVTQPVSIATMPTTPVTGTFWQATQPVSIASMPSTPVTGTFWQTTQPVSGTIAATESGVWNVNQTLGTPGYEAITDGTHGPAAVKVASAAAVATDPALVVAISPNNTVAVTGTFWQTTQPVSIAAMPTTPVNFTQLNGVALGSPSNYGTSPGAVAVEGVNAFITNTPAVTITSGTVTTVSTVTALTTVTNPVKIEGNAGGILDGATGAAVPVNALYKGARAATANPTNATGGNLVGVMADKAGRLVVTSGHVRDLQGTQTTTIAASGTETTIVTAGAAGVFNDLCALVISGQSTAATVWTLRNTTAGTPIASFNVPVGATALPFVITFNPPLAQTTAATNWTIQAGTGTSTGAQIFAQFIKNT